MPLILLNALSLEAIYLYPTNLSGDEFTSLRHVLVHLTNLQRIALDKNSKEDFHQVALALSVSKSLKKVFLVADNLQFAGAQTKAGILTRSRTIQQLFIYDTTIGYEGAKLLCKEVMKNSAQKLHLPHEYHEWMYANQPQLAPLDTVSTEK